MLLEVEDLKQLCKEACMASRNAGDLIMAYYGSNIEKKQKKAGSSEASSIVTEVDFKSQSLIFSQLETSLAKFDLGILAEETADNKSRFQKEYFWCIDPLDGTKPFSENKPGFSVSIALIERSGKPLIGVVYDPVNQNLYSAVSRNGAFKNEKPWKVKPAKSRTLSFYYNQSFTKLDSFPRVINQLEVTAKNEGLDGIAFPQGGGAALNALWAAENTPSCFFAYPKSSEGGGSIWDYAASACIYTELGLHVSDIFGNPLDLNNKTTSFMNRKGVLYASNNNIGKEINQYYQSGLFS
jgi:fructose-1,6-bisphosphatase/inositol monophosphatase family enzyme